MAAPNTPAVETPASTLDAGLLKLAHDIEQALSGSPEFIGPGGLRFNVAERLRYLLAESKARPQYGIRWLSGEPKLFTHLDRAVDELHSDNRYFRNSRLFERTVTDWRPRPESGDPGWARATPPAPF